MDIIQTDNAPAAIGPYSQAVTTANLVFISGQIPLVPESGLLVGEDFESQLNQVFLNLEAICEAAGGNLQNVVKFTVYLTDLANFNMVNDLMATKLQAPYPARAAIEVSNLPRNALVEIDAVMEK